MKRPPFRAPLPLLPRFPPLPHPLLLPLLSFAEHRRKIPPRVRKEAKYRGEFPSGPTISLTVRIFFSPVLFIQEEELHYNVTAGIVLSDHSLVLQSITRESAGRYSCTAVNVEGRATSNVVDLEVMCEYILSCCVLGKKEKKKEGRKYLLFFISDLEKSLESKDAVCFACKKKTVAPVCKHVLNSAGWRYQNATPPPLNVPEEIHGALKHETIGLVCEVEANPATVTFHWTFNSSGDLAGDIPPARYSNEGTSSRLNYTPSSDQDYGTLACWASNAVGPSKQPCLYQVIAAGSSFTICRVS